jgi:hypothetical protein
MIHGPRGLGGGGSGRGNLGRLLLGAPPYLTRAGEGVVMVPAQWMREAGEALGRWVPAAKIKTQALSLDP